MAQSIKNVVVLGAGGSIGPSILLALDSHNFNITILTRTSSTSTFSSKYTIQAVADDYPTDELIKVFTGQDAIVSCISPWVTTLQKQIISAAVKAGVKRFIPAEFGPDTTNARAIKLLPPLKVRGDIVEYLKEQESSGLSWTAIVTGSFFDWGLANGWLGFDFEKKKAIIFDNGDVLFSTSTVVLIGSAVSRVLLKPEMTKNRHLFVSSFTTSQNQILAVAEKLSGSSWEVERVSSKAKIVEANEALAEGKDLVAASRLLILSLHFSKGHGSDFTGRDSNAELEMQKEDMEKVVENVMSGPIAVKYM